MNRSSVVQISTEQKNKSPINNSKAKAQYSFSKADRFVKKSHSSATDIRFYDLPSQRSKRFTTFGIGGRDNLMRKSNTPDPTRYNPQKKWMSKTGFNFGVNRDSCKANNIFQLNDNPGPGRYHPNEKLTYKSLYYSIGKKIKTQENHGESPGPIYSLQSTMLDQKKFLSTYIKKNMTKIYPIRNEILKEKHVGSPKKQKQHENRFVNSKGWRQMGKDGRKVCIPLSERFKTEHKVDDRPGPGTYTAFSEFIDVP